MRTSNNTPNAMLNCERCPSIHPQERTDRGQGRVRFCEEDGTGTDRVTVTIVGPLLNPASAMSDEEKQAIWWSKSDCRAFTLNARLLGKETILRESGGDSKGYKMVILNAQQACELVEEPTTELRHNLKRWISAADSRRGIERLCIPEARALRAERITNTVHSVLWAQGYFSDMCWDCKAELTRSISESRSHGARSFARLLGDCDAHAARSEALRGLRRAALWRCKSSSENELSNAPPAENKAKSVGQKSRRHLPAAA